jgi:hypothetical protein
VVAGQNQNQASNTLGAQGLTFGTTIQQSSTQYPAGTVIGSDPPAGTSVRPGSTVNLLVSTGPPPPPTTTEPPTTTTSTTSPSSSSTTSTPAIPHNRHH